jgi:hypothetical protein
MLRYNKFAGATATIGAHDNTRPASAADVQKATATVNTTLVDWEAQFQSFAQSFGVDLDAGGLLVVPEGYDMRDVPPRYRLQIIQQGSTFGLVRNPSGVIPAKA